MPPHRVVMIHGIQSSGSWYATVSHALWPFFCCQSIRYRQYHALGLVNIFFWPWALLFAGLLGWQSVHLRPDVWSWVAVAAIFLVGVVEAICSGPARLLPWLLVGAFWLAASGDPWTAPALVAGVFVVAMLGWVTTESKRRSAVYWLMTLPLALAAWIAGFLCLLGSPWTMLAVCSVVVAAYLAWCEWDWNGFGAGILTPLVIGIGAPVLSLLVPVDLQASLVWAGLVLLMMFLELQESTHDGLWEHGWLMLVGLLAVLTFLAWPALDTWPYVGYVWAAILMGAGWREPVDRVRRTVARILALADTARQSHGPGHANWVAHSLGTYLSGQAFSQPGWQLRRVLFVGGAISENFVWQTYFEGDAPSIHDVRNEHGTYDIVIWALWMSGRWARGRGLGGAGWTGFLAGPHEVHDLMNPRVGCATCPVDPPVRVHNLRLDEYRHSTYFLSRHHAQSYWLPYLWGHSPDEVRAFYDRCLTLYDDQVDRHDHREKFRNTLAEFLKQQWNWYRSGTRPFTAWVDDYVGQQSALLDARFPGMAPPPSQLVHEAAAVELADRVFRAMAQRENATPTNLKLLKCLNPPSGIRPAAKVAFTKVAQELAAR